MNDLILAKMREGDWGEVVRLMREDARMHDKSHHSSKEMDFAFFRMMVEDKLCYLADREPAGVYPFFERGNAPHPHG